MTDKEPVQSLEILLQPDTLWKRVKEVTENALKSGALLSIPTDFEFVEQDDVSFLVRTLSNLVRKDEAKKKQEKHSATSGKDFNPFLPYEQDLWVADVSATHACILNKFNVVDYHLLIVTREFEEQESLLTLADFTALCACLASKDGLAFYNGGTIAGASQKHKHLQLVPLPLVTTGVKLPIEPLLAKAIFEDNIAAVPGFPFVNAFTKLDTNWFQSPVEAGEKLFRKYQDLLSVVGIQGISNKQSAAYNFLATREWMLIIPRKSESFAGISVNSLGFAGSLFVKNQEQMQVLKAHKPMSLLESVALPRF